MDRIFDIEMLNQSKDCIFDLEIIVPVTDGTFNLELYFNLQIEYLISRY